MSSCRQTEMDEAVAALKENYEREKNLLTEENRKLTAETDKVTQYHDYCSTTNNTVVLLLRLSLCSTAAG